MDHDEARRVLGLEADASVLAIREAHRRRIRVAHPDAGGSVQAAARVNEAFDTLRRSDRADRSDRAGSTASSAATSPSVDVGRRLVVDAPESDLLARLAEAGHAVGEVVSVDHAAGIIEIVVGDAPAVGHLAVAVGEAQAGGTPVSFTLEPLGVTPAPPIGDVVRALMAALSD